MHSSSRDIVRVTALLGLALLGACSGYDNHTKFGPWEGSIELDRTELVPGQPLMVMAELRVHSDHFPRMAAAGIPVDKVVMLVTAERTFDADGWMRLPSDERMSTLLTPTGLAIEGGNPGPVTQRFGYAFASPVDELVEIPPPSTLGSSHTSLYSMSMRFTARPTLPADLPPGLYRLRVDFGVKSKGSYRNLDGNGLGSRPFPPSEGSYLYTSILPASGRSVAGVEVDAKAIRPRFPWVLLARYNSNGYQGVVAEEDRARFALSPRNIIPDEVVLPLYQWGTSVASYSLEPTFPVDSIDTRSNIPWDFSRGELGFEITAPDGVTTVQPATPIVGTTSSGGPTTRHPAFTDWKPTGYGAYTVKLTGWIADRSGRRYEGGGTYRFWIAKRMTMATATFQGMPYPVGAKYGRDIAFAPPVPAQVEITATLYPRSGPPGPTQTITSSGTATAGGLFGAAQGLTQLALDEPGEYHGKILAKYTDPEGHLWVCAMRHAGVVYAPDSPIVARGKKLRIGQEYLAQGETRREGRPGSLEHITFPYNPGDVLLIASGGQGANKIEPVLIYEKAGESPTWDTKLNGIGTTNLYIRTSNGYSPHLFPEYMTDIEYFYAAAPRPGFMSRFLVGESVVRAPYWSTSPNGFGGQIGASSNGDLPGDIYRLLGGVVMRDKDQPASYAGYVASAFLLPSGSNNNRVIAPGAEDLLGPVGQRARFFLVGFRPGMALVQGASWRPAVQIDPILPATVRTSLYYPSDSTVPVKTWEGVGDAFGSWAGADTYTLNEPGIYRYELSATWSGFEGRMPGLPSSGGEFYVLPATRPAGANGLAVDLPNQSRFDPGQTFVVNGRSTASKVRYSLIMPGAVLAQGDIPVSGGQFQLEVDPAALNRTAPIYDIRSISTGKPQIGRVLHLSLFAEESTQDGTRFWDFRRVVVRGSTILSTR